MSLNPDFTGVNNFIEAAKNAYTMALNFTPMRDGDKELTGELQELLGEVLYYAETQAMKIAPEEWAKTDLKMVTTVIKSLPFDELENGYPFNVGEQIKSLSYLFAELPGFVESITRGRELLSIDNDHDGHMELLHEVNKRISGVKSSIRVMEVNLEKKLADCDAILDDASGAVREKRDTVVAELEKTQKKHVELLETYREEVSSIASDAAGRVMAKDHLESTAYHRTCADTWSRRASLSFVLAASTFLILVALEVFPPTRDFLKLTPGWDSFVSRFGLAGVFAALGAYCSRESSRHRAREFEAESLSLSLQLLSPFIAQIDSDHQGRIKADIARSLFLGASMDEDKTSAAQYESNMMVVEALRLATETLRNEAKSRTGTS